MSISWKIRHQQYCCSVIQTDSLSSLSEVVSIYPNFKRFNNEWVRVFLERLFYIFLISWCMKTKISLLYGLYCSVKINEINKYFLMQECIFSSPSYYVWGTLVIMQIFDFRFWWIYAFWGSGESKKHKIRWCPGVR